MLDAYMRALTRLAQDNLPTALGGIPNRTRAPYGTVPPPQFTTEDTQYALPGPLDILPESKPLDPLPPVAQPNVDSVRSVFEAFQGLDQPQSNDGATEIPGISQVAQAANSLRLSPPKDRFERMAILNEQERNRKPTTAGKDATINLDTLPEQLKEVYAQRAELAKQRAALSEQFPGRIPGVVTSEADKAVKAKEYADKGLAIPAVYQPMATPERVAADKQQRAKDESRRQGNWSLIEQVRGLTNKLGVNPAVATAIVADRMQSAGGGSQQPSGSWNPQLSGNLSQMLGPFLQSAAYGPQGAAFIERQKVDNQGKVDAVNAARGGMSAEQAAGLAAGRALIESGDPAAIQQGIQMVRQYLASNPQANPMQRLPAPGIGSDVQHAAANLYQNDAIDSLIGSVFNNTNLGTGPDRFTWNESGVNAAKERAIRELEGRGLQNARQMVDDWYKRKFDNSWFGSWVMPSPQG